MSDPNCPFCKIVKGEIESKTVYSDSKVMAVLDINPATKGHVLIFPKAHHSIMPVIPPDEFKHLVKKAYCLSQSIKSSVASTSSKIFIANGGVAGQQSSHFLMHIIPDGSLFNIFGNQEVDNTAYEALKKNVGIMMGNHYKREGKIHNPIETSNLFEKENFSIEIPKNLCVKGHLQVVSKSNEFTASHVEDLFYASSYGATASFEYLGAEGSNIIFHDDPGDIKIDVIPRFSNDGLDFQWNPIKVEENDMVGLKDAISMSSIGMDAMIKNDKASVAKVVKNNFSYDDFKNVKSNGESFISMKFK